MMRRAIMAAGTLAASTVLIAACGTAPEAIPTPQTPEQAELQQTASECAGTIYDRMFLKSGERLYKAADRTQITSMLRDSAVPGQGADAESERRIRNIIGDGYGQLFLGAYQGCMAALT